MRISVEEDLKGRTVIDHGGRSLGLVDGVLVDSQSWRVEAFRVRLRREAADEIGISHGVFGPALLDVPVTLVHAAGDAIILNVATAALRELVPADRAEHASP